MGCGHNDQQMTCLYTLLPANFIASATMARNHMTFVLYKNLKKKMNKMEQVYRYTLRRN